MSENKKVAVIGGGWYGCYCALRLRQLGISVTLYEAKHELFRGVSENYGNRLHAGPHYPRSAVTRKECQNSCFRFMQEFPELYLDHKEATYGLGTKDSDGLPSRVDWETFTDVCEECEMFGQVKPVNCEQNGYTNLVGAFNIVEPSVYLDEPRHYFTKKLPEIGVNMILNHKVKDVNVVKSDVLVDGEVFGHVVNCTYYKSFVSKKPLPFDKNVFYQPSLTLLYAQRSEYTEMHHPFSFTVMDGWFPSIMPALYKRENPYDKEREVYFLYHAKYTLLGSFDTIEEGNAVVDGITDEWVLKEFKPKMEESARLYYPCFDDEFEYLGWKVSISCKIRSSTEFRSAIVWSDGPMIHVLSGKVGTIFQAGDDVVDFIEKQNKKTEKGIDRAACELKHDNLLNYKGAGSLQTRLELNFYDSI